MLKGLSCRECCERLAAARQVLTGSSGNAGTTDASSADYRLSAQRVERCLSILERFAEACQVCVERFPAACIRVQCW